MVHFTGLRQNSFLCILFLPTIYQPFESLYSAASLMKMKVLKDY